MSLRGRAAAVVESAAAAEGLVLFAASVSSSAVWATFTTWNNDLDRIASNIV